MIHKKCLPPTKVLRILYSVVNLFGEVIYKKIVTTRFNEYNKMCQRFFYLKTCTAIYIYCQKNSF